MPFAANERPALGVSLLKAHLRRDGVPCDIAYLNLAFAELLGRRSYERLVHDLPFRAMPGEWVFAESLWGSSSGLPGTYVDDILRGRWAVSREDVDLVEFARGSTRGFLDHCLREVPWADYDVVGFSSSTSQNLASLALARRVKEAHPGLVMVFGGADWQGVQGLEQHRRFPFVDYACSGEADVSFPLLIRWLGGCTSVDPEAVPGLIYRRAGTSVANPQAEPLANLDALPVPDYSDFYTARHRHADVRAALPCLTIEASRGCWWAAKHPCVFCGIDGRDRVYRAKSPARIIAELRELSGLWPSSFIQLADTVVPSAFLDEVLPAVALDPLPVRLFFEVRPGLTRQQIEAIAKVGAHIQPGIESLNDNVLRLMHKGSRALENVRLLKWCRALGVDVHWNLLHGLPGETQADYDEMLRMFPAIRFLAAPLVSQAVSVDRYSPYFEHPRRHGIRHLSSFAPYRYLYPFPEQVLERIAYAFEYECDGSHVLPDVASSLSGEVTEWRRQSKLGDLRVARDEGRGMTLLDKRPGAALRTVELNELERFLYRACDDIGELSAVEARAAASLPRLSDPGQAARGALDSMVERRLMIRIGERYLSLALPQEYA